MNPPAGTWVRVCRVEEIPEGFALGVTVEPSVGADGSRPTAALATQAESAGVCVALDGDRPQAMLDRCPHRDIGLSGGVVRDGLVTCPGHFRRYSLADGHRTDQPGESATLYPTRLDEDGWVWALTPAPAPKLGMREWLLRQAHSETPAT